MTPKEAQKLKDDLWDLYGHLNDDDWPEEARQQWEEASEILHTDWEKRYARRQARKQKRLTEGKEWHKKTFEQELRERLEAFERKYPFVTIANFDEEW